jgi:two-component system sensor histidine kinase AlgZ
VTVSGCVEAGQVRITVTKPVAATRVADERPGNRLALENIRQRLRLAYGERGAIDVVREPDEYRVTIRFPYEE